MKRSKLGRRLFLQAPVMLMGGLAGGLANELRAVANLVPGGGAADVPLAANLVPMALAEDGVGIISASSGWHAQVVAAGLPKLRDLAASAGVLRVGPDGIFEALSRARTELTKPSESSGQRLAVIFGWFFHRAARELIYPEGQPEARLSDKQIYQDVALLKAIYVQQGVWGARSKTANAPRVSDAQALFAAAVQRSFIRLHTLEPDGDDVRAWIGRVLLWRREVDLLAERYGKVYASPSPSVWRKFVTAPAFIDTKDVPVEAALAARLGRAAPLREPRDFLSIEVKSLYGQALQRGLTWAWEANAFLVGKNNGANLQTLLGAA